MPAPEEIDQVRRFVYATMWTYGIVIERVPRESRDLLREALEEFAPSALSAQADGRQRIVEQYSALTDDEKIRDAGLYGSQLRAKVELAIMAGKTSRAS